MAKWNRAMCANCHVVFVKEKEDQSCCSLLCEAKKNAVKEKNACIICASPLFEDWGKGTCSSNCLRVANLKEWEEFREKPKEKLGEKKKTAIEKANERWANTPYDTDKHKQEVKRSGQIDRAWVFGKRSYNHFTSGRKWDFI